MAKNDRNLNINIVNEEKDNDVIVSFSTFFKKLKKYLFIWIVAAVVFFVAAFGYATITTHVNKAPLEALIGFSYSGVEKGKDPNGRKFDINTVKNPAVIEMALTDLGMDLTDLELIRQGISFQGLVPKNVMDKLTVYNSIIEQGNNSSLTAAEKVLDTSYFSTQYIVYFDYNDIADMDDDDAELIFNTILEKYTDYFYELYGYNEAIGNSLAAIDYTTYDYSEALDVFAINIKSLKKYVKQLADDDSTRFRSADTGYTFSDLYQALHTVESLDIDKIASYISIYNITKDKDKAMAYYENRIKNLGRDKAEYEERLESVTSSIENYEKDQVMVFGGTDNISTESKVSSAQYDKMFNQKISLSAELAETKQRIAYYKERLENLKKGQTGTKAMEDRVVEDLAALNVKVNDLVDLVCRTSEDYYRNVTFGNAYNVLVPAVNASARRISRIVDNAKLPFVILEFLGVAVYFCVAFVEALISDGRKSKAIALAGTPAAAGGDDDDDDDTDAPEPDAEETEEKKDKKKKK